MNRIATRPDTTRRFVIAFGAGALVMLALDSVWLTLAADRLYRPAIGHLMREGFDVTAAALFYVVYLTGVTIFAVLSSTGTGMAAARGALFGFVAYATYDLTNQATLKNWPWHVTAIDLCWGSFLTATVAAAAYRAFSAAARR